MCSSVEVWLNSSALLCSISLSWVDEMLCMAQWLQPCQRTQVGVRFNSCAREECVKPRLAQLLIYCKLSWLRRCGYALPRSDRLCNTAIVSCSYRAHLLLDTFSVFQRTNWGICNIFVSCSWIHQRSVSLTGQPWQQLLSNSLRLFYIKRFYFNSKETVYCAVLRFWTDIITRFMEQKYVVRLLLLLFNVVN